MRSETKKRRVIIICAVVAALVVFFGCVLAFKWDSIFQRGNPMPYVKAMLDLSEDNTFVEIGNENNTYITKAGDNQVLFQMIQDTYDVECVDRGGRMYFFTNTNGEYVCSVEVEQYWSIYDVWTLRFE